ncbi:hypothetical protein Q7P37_000078 [Cladosporium fusiforme]
MSSSLYDPDQDALPGDLDFIRLLSQRDLSSAVPINFVTVPGVLLTPACFPFRRYDSASTTKCVSNLLAAGFRRLEVDLYWDVSRTTWSFCPVELGDVQPQLSLKQDSTTSQTRSTTATLANDELRNTNTRSTSTGVASENTVDARLLPRQTDEASVLSRSSTALISASSVPSATSTRTATLTDDTSTAVMEGSQPESTDTSNDSTILRVGDYICSPHLDFHHFLSVLDGHFANTEDNLNATTKYIILNIHSAAPASDSNGRGSSPSEENLPQGNNLLSSLISANNSQYLYTPTLLREQRADINKAGSWLTVPQANSPDTAFYKVDSSNRVDSTPDGWPSEGVVEFARARRMLAAFGTISPEMRGYDRSSDASTIFPPGYLQDSHDVGFTNAGNVSSGCLLNTENPSVSAANSSWAISDISSSPDSTASTAELLLLQAGNLTDCGISPILNNTLLNSSADTDPLPYKSFALTTIWSWAADEPRAPQSNDDADQTTERDNRCAVLNATSQRWQAHDCSNSHHAACRIEHSPYDFSISDANVAYGKAGDACRGEPYGFAAARSALENAHLASAWRSYRESHDIADELLWVDFNDLDVARCWVIGRNSTCPYQEQQVGEGRIVIVPTVAAVVVFVLALLTIFIKCASNRRNTRRRRKRGDDGWDYEGVPS